MCVLLIHLFDLPPTCSRALCSEHRNVPDRFGAHVWPRRVDSLLRQRQRLEPLRVLRPLEVDAVPLHRACASPDCPGSTRGARCTLFIGLPVCADLLALKQTIRPLLSRVRAMVSSYKNSPAAWRTFVATKRLKKDCPTRWSSTFAVL
jgi:hypothetical protein